MKPVVFALLICLPLVACSRGAVGVPEIASNPIPVSSADLDACGADSKERSRLLLLSPDEFDQDMTGGWRTVADRPGCELAAATLLLAYINENGIEPDTGVMHWHLGQMLALAGQDVAAIPWMEGTRQGDLAWGLYVDGTIAFLADDEAGLDAAINSLATIEVSEAEKAMRREFLRDHPEITMHDGFVDEPQNLNVLEGLRECFEQPYSAAYGCRP